MKIVGMNFVLGAAAAVTMTAGTAVAGLIEKPPDVGPWWNPLGPNGSYVYADSFVADETGPVDIIGTWLESLAGPGLGSDLAFEVWGSIGGNPANGPDAFNVIASTGLFDFGGGTATLDFYSAGTAFSGNLTAGTTYWFAATAIGGNPGDGPYRVGGHTQNSVYNDNGTFWYSNDPAGVNFDGQNLTPEMAFSVNIVPAPAAIAMFGIVGLVGTRRRRRE